ncbi:MAG: MmgE/PrpD family protein, partial [Miltoncostaeaceae bacterium]
MVEYEVRAWRSAEPRPRGRELAWHIASLAADPGPVAPEVADLVADRLLDDLAVAVAALGRPAPAAARAQALPHRMAPGAPLIGLGTAGVVSPEWAAWANGTAVRDLDMHDTYLAADYAHPGDTIPPLLAVAHHAGLSGAALVPAVAVAYEVQMALVRGICLHEHRIDHIAHLAPAVAAGRGARRARPPAAPKQAVQPALRP